jgi:putative FmdB family regulatory protein
MPLYEFRCERCGEEFEDLVSSPERVDEVSCPRCDGREVRRLQSGFATPGGSSRPGAGASGCSSTGPGG